MQKLKLFLISLSLSGFLQAQDTTSFNFTFNHLALSVKDLDRSVEEHEKMAWFLRSHLK